MLRTAKLLPPMGLLTLGFDPTRFQAKPPACYRASWQLLGRAHTRWRRRAYVGLSYSIAPPTLGARCFQAKNVRCVRLCVDLAGLQGPSCSEAGRRSSPLASHCGDALPGSRTGHLRCVRRGVFRVLI